MGGPACPRLARKAGAMCRDTESSLDPKAAPGWEGGLFPPGRSGFLSKWQSFEKEGLRGHHSLGVLDGLLLPQARASSGWPCPFQGAHLQAGIFESCCCRPVPTVTLPPPISAPGGQAPLPPACWVSKSKVRSKREEETPGSTPGGGLLLLYLPFPAPQDL